MLINYVHNSGVKGGKVVHKRRVRREKTHPAFAIDEEVMSSLKPEPYKINDKLRPIKQSKSCPYIYRHLSADYLRFYERPKYINQTPVEHVECSVYPTIGESSVRPSPGITPFSSVYDPPSSIERVLTKYDKKSKRESVYIIPDDSKCKDLSFPRITRIACPSNEKERARSPVIGLDKTMEKHYKDCNPTMYFIFIYIFFIISSTELSPLSSGRSHSSATSHDSEGSVIKMTLGDVLDDLKMIHTTKTVVPCSIPSKKEKEKMRWVKYYVPPPKHPKEFPPPKKRSDCTKFGLKGAKAFRPNVTKFNTEGPLVAISVDLQ